MTCGAIAGFGILVAGPLVGVLAVGMLLLLASIPGREATVGGFMVGFGATWLVVFARATLTCGRDCIAPDMTPWFVAAGGFVAIGGVLTARAARGQDAS
jgi:hypothetical protein